MNKKLDITVHNTIHDDEGRYVMIYVTLFKVKWLLISVYAPNEDKPEFFQKLFKDVQRFSPDHLIMGGDLNLGMDPQIDRKGSFCNNDKAGKWLSTHIQNEQILDVWRTLHPDEGGYTWRKAKPRISCSRLDYILCSG